MNTFAESVLSKTIFLIKQAQGFRSQVYLDTKGYQTIGYGHKLRPHQIGKLTSVTHQEAEQLMLQELQSVQKQVKNYWGNSLNAMKDQKIAVLLDMTYNCGKVRWPKLTKAIQDKNWNQAAVEILNSKYKDDVKVRAYRNAQIMRNGVIRSNKDFIKLGTQWVLK